MTVRKFALAATALAGLAFASAPANAAFINFAGDGTFLGSFNNFPTPDFSVKFGDDVFATAGFDHYYIFEYIGGKSDLSVNFTPAGGITGFNGELYNATATCGAAGTVCGSYAVGTSITPFTAAAGGGIGFVEPLTAGFYAVRVGGAVPLYAEYTGQIFFKELPEPGSLALLGLGLMGIGFVRRRAAG